MKCFLSPTILCAVVVAASALPQHALAQSPRQQLREALTSLQADTASSDSTLREKIIKLVLTLDPPPAVPDEVAKLTGRAVYAFKNATTPADYEESIKAYKRALLLAPWVAKNYYNLGVVQEKAGKPSEAIRSFEWYLLSAPNASDATEVRERIGGLEFAVTKVAEEHQKEVAAANVESDKRETFEAFKRAVQGLRYTEEYCNNREAAAQGRIIGAGAGCTWSEMSGVNWYKFLGSTTSYFWVFHDDYATLECEAAGVTCPPVRVRALGKGFKNLVFDTQGFEPLPDRWFPRPLIGWNASFSQFTLGVRISSRSEALGNPEKRFEYTLYKAINAVHADVPTTTLKYPALVKEVPVEGMLEPGDSISDPQDKSAVYIDRYVFHGTAGERIHIRATARGSLTMATPELSFFEPDWNTPMNTSSVDYLHQPFNEITLILPKTGTYVVEVAGGLQRDHGPYTLLVESAP